MKHLIPAISLISTVLPAGAVTLLIDGANLNAPGSWTNGLPAAGNDGTIEVTSATNSATVFGFGSDTVTNLISGTITASDGFNLIGGTWNITGGKIITRYFLSNGDGGATTVVNISGGEIELKSTSSNFISTANGGVLNVSGSAVLNAATGPSQNMSNPNGDINFAPDWIGQWSVGSFTGDSWRTLFTTDPSMKFDGANLDGASFDTIFTVSGDGQTLSLTSPVPEPASLSLVGLAFLGTALRRRR